MRELHTVVEDMVKLVPANELGLKRNFEQILLNCGYRPPEDKRGWQEAQVIIDDFPVDVNDFKEYHKAIVNVWLGREFFTLSTKEELSE